MQRCGFSSRRWACRLPWTCAPEGSLGSAPGAQPRDVLTILATQGVPHETDWPYAVTKYNDAPPAALGTEAAEYLALKFRVPFSDLNNLKAGLALGFPFTFGFTVYDS